MSPIISRSPSRKLNLVLAFAAFSAGACGDATSGDVASLTQDVLDGVQVNHAAYPSVGQVWSATTTPNRYNTGTGTLIGSRYVITAAHVVWGQSAQVTPNVFVNLDTGSGPVSYDVEAMFIPASYLQVMNDPALSKIWEGNSKATQFDVAVLRLKQAPAGIVPMALSAATPSVGTPVNFLGYGQIATGGGTPTPAPDGMLYAGTNRIFQVDETYANMRHDRGTSGLYHGDSGGPALIGSGNRGSMQLTAVDTSGSGYTYGATDTLTRLSTIRPWIDDILAGGYGLYPSDAYEGVEQTRAAIALSTLGHYSEPRTFTDAADVDTLSFRLDAQSHVRLSVPHHYGRTVPFPVATLSKNGVSIPIATYGIDATYETDLSSGTYTLTVANAYARGLSYSLGVSVDGWFLQGDPYEGADGPSSSFGIGLDSVLDRNLFPRNDSDRVRFVLNEASNVRIETLPVSGTPDNDYSTDTVISLRNNSNAELASSDDLPNSYCSRIDTFLAAGTYSVVTTGYNGSQVNYYGLRVSKR